MLTHRVWGRGRERGRGGPRRTVQRLIKIVNAILFLASCNKLIKVTGVLVFFSFFLSFNSSSLSNAIDVYCWLTADRRWLDMGWVWVPFHSGFKIKFDW